MPEMLIPELVFLVLAFLITLCSVMVITSRNPVTSAVFLVVDLFLLAGVYATLDAHFIAIIQILIYAGAIVVLFMFVIMLLNLNPNERHGRRLAAPEVAVLLLTLVGFLVIAVTLGLGKPSGASGELTQQAIQSVGGNTYALGIELFSRYLWPFELASILILLAVVASIVIAKKDKPASTDAASAKRRPAHAVR